jgi:hypothetical protein
MTLSITKLSITKFSKKAVSIMTLSITVKNAALRIILHTK